MKKVFLLISGLIFTLSSFAQTWSLDKSHAKLSFSIVHLMISEQEGYFKLINATVKSSKEDFSDAVIEFTADVNSINTDNEKRDEHLKGADYFDVAKYPTITFKSKGFTKVGDKKYKLVGDLTVKGVSKPVELDVTYFGTITHPKNQKKIAGFKVIGVVKRSDYGIGGAGTATLGDEVTITSNLEFIKD